MPVIIMEELRQFIHGECALFPSNLPNPVSNVNDVRRLVEIAYKAFQEGESIDKAFFVEGFNLSERHSFIDPMTIEQVSYDYCEKANEYKEVMRIMNDNNLKL